MLVADFAGLEVSDMTCRITVSLLLLVLSSAAAWAQIPPGYYVEQFSATPFQDAHPQINNNSGQIVFDARMDGSDASGEIFLYDNGKLIRLTNDDLRDRLPAINDQGVITWARSMGPMGRFGPTAEIVVWEDGELTRLTDNAVEDTSPKINNLGHVVWLRFMGPGCRGVTMDLFFFDGEEIRRLTTDGEQLGLANQVTAINDHDQIVWTKYDFCQDPWESMIMLLSDGESTRLSTEEMLEPQSPDINNKGQIAWDYSDRENGRNPIVIWENGRAQILTDGLSARLNESLHVAFNLWDLETDAWQQYLYRDGRRWQLTNDPFWNRANSINDAGEIVWRSGDTGTSDIRYMRRFASGDLDCDGSLDLMDVEPFILALIDPDEYPKQYPACDFMLGDINADGSLDLLDVEPFIELLLA